VPRERYVSNMLELAATARAHGAAAVLLGPVYRDRVAHPPEGDEIHGYRDALRAAAATAGFPYLEIPELTEDAHPDNARLFLEHIHPNHRGHRLIADRLLAFLAARGLLGGLEVPPPGADPLPQRSPPHEGDPQPAPAPHVDPASQP
jgi:lysophospholipase L1-like esterase